MKMIFSGFIGRFSSRLETLFPSLSQHSPLKFFAHRCEFSQKFRSQFFHRKIFISSRYRDCFSDEMEFRLRWSRRLINRDANTLLRVRGDVDLRIYFKFANCLFSTTMNQDFSYRRSINFLSDFDSEEVQFSFQKHPRSAHMWALWLQ